MKSYDVTVTREGRWWMIEIPELDGLTQARRLDEVEKMAREYVAVTLDVPLSRVAVSISTIEVAGQDVLEAKALVEELRQHARQLEALVADLMREFASALADADVPVRDVSNVLGVSHQRVSQLVQEATKDRTSELAQIVLAARKEQENELIVHLRAGQSPQVLEVKSSSKKAHGSKRSRPRRTASHEVARVPVRKSVAPGNVGEAHRSAVAGRSSAKKAKAKNS
jgi:predicted XRE-type DNA-binding protein